MQWSHSDYPMEVAGDLENLGRQKNDIYPAIIFLRSYMCVILYSLLNTERKLSSH